jgi:hypothetical protein
MYKSNHYQKRNLPQDQPKPDDSVFGQFFIWRFVVLHGRDSTLSSPWQKSRASMRAGSGPGLRRRDDAVLIEIRASLDNEEPCPRTQVATVRLLSRAVSPRQMPRSSQRIHLNPPFHPKNQHSRSIPHDTFRDTAPAVDPIPLPNSIHIKSLVKENNVSIC